MLVADKSATTFSDTLTDEAYYDLLQIWYTK